jgi:hypothetical protein
MHINPVHNPMFCFLWSTFILFLCLSLPNGVQSYKLWSKGKFVPADAIKPCRRSRGIAPLIPNFENSWRSVVNFTHRPRKKIPVPTEWEARWNPELVWEFCRRGNSPAPTGIRTTLKYNTMRKVRAAAAATAASECVCSWLHLSFAPRVYTLVLERYRQFTFLLNQASRRTREQKRKKKEKHE